MRPSILLVVTVMDVKEVWMIGFVFVMLLDGELKMMTQEPVIKVRELLDPRRKLYLLAYFLLVLYFQSGVTLVLVRSKKIFSIIVFICRSHPTF